MSARMRPSELLLLKIKIKIWAFAYQRHHKGTENIAHEEAIYLKKLVFSKMRTNGEGMYEGYKI